MRFFILATLEGMYKVSLYMVQNSSFLFFFVFGEILLSAQTCACVIRYTWICVFVKDIISIATPPPNSPVLSAISNVSAYSLLYICLESVYVICVCGFMAKAWVWPLKE